MVLSMRPRKEFGNNKNDLFSFNSSLLLGFGFLRQALMYMRLALNCWSSYFHFPSMKLQVWILIYGLDGPDSLTKSIFTSSPVIDWGSTGGLKAHEI